MSRYKRGTVTELQLKVLRFIVDYQRKHNKAPTYPKVCDMLGAINHNSAGEKIRSLKQKGLLRRGTVTHGLYTVTALALQHLATAQTKEG